ncbi:hypothetical protein [Actinoplanes solisilvae]|uniref:hypothetical protein n=1 Tax=Actinoplanes solisilvae TaxID=2486853 RepID=UPI001F0C3211|nr:hypothetical protein [Actinoplanes solisilvae]
MGSDLAAQQARADFFATHGYTPIDLRWYAGVDQLGYSLTSQPVMALLGVRVTGALTLLAGAILFAVLLRRTEAPRPLLGAVVGTLCLAGNLVSGRVTYGLGVCLGLAALVALTTAHPARPTTAHPASRRARPAFWRARPTSWRAWLASWRAWLASWRAWLASWRAWLAPVLALLAAATSPVAALFLGLAGAALLLSGRVRPGLMIAVPAAIPLALTALLFGDGGWMNISRTDTLLAVVASLAVAVLVPLRPIRVGALLSAAGVLAASLIHTPVGLNATRLSVTFTLPLLAAYAALPRLSSRVRSPLDPNQSPPPTAPSDGTPPSRAGLRAARPLPRWAVLVLLVVACWWQPPVVTGDLRDIGNPTADAAFFQPLRDRLGQEQLTGRLEIPATRDYWEAAHLGEIPLARGWLRQADIDRNPLFFTDIPGARGTGVALTPDSYRAWLDELAVQFVAVPDTELTWSGRPEAELITAGLPYLTEIWQDRNWRLYRVTDPRPIVATPATLVRQGSAALTFDAPAAGAIPLRLRWNRWLTIDGGSLERDGDWVVARVPRPGRYTVTS